MIRVLALSATLIASPAFAQQPTTAAPPATPQQRIGAQIGALVIENASLAAQNEQLRTQLDVAAARIKAMDDKCTPREPSAAPPPPH